jgi:hypothetical protein
VQSVWYPIAYRSRSGTPRTTSIDIAPNAA